MADGTVLARRALLAGALALTTITVVEATVTWSATSTLNTSVTGAPVLFQLGDGGSNNRYVQQITISQDGTFLDARIKSRAGAEIYVTDVVRIVNPGATPTTVRLEGSTVVNPFIDAFAWHIRDGANELGSLDHRKVSPSTTFTVPGSSHVELDLELETKEGAGRNNAKVSFDLTLVPP